MSTPLLIKVQQILNSTELFSNYIVALKLDNPSASHTQVMQSLQTFLSHLPETIRLQILKVFAEQEASDSMGNFLSLVITHACMPASLTFNMQNIFILYLNANLQLLWFIRAFWI